MVCGCGSFGRRKTYTVRDDVRVTLEAALGVTVGLLITGKVPDDQGLVAGCGQQHVGAIIKNSSQNFVPSKIQSSDRDRSFLLLQGGGKGSNPAIVALKGAAKNQLLSHDGNETMKEREGWAEIVVDSGG